MQSGLAKGAPGNILTAVAPLTNETETPRLGLNGHAATSYAIATPT